MGKETWSKDYMNFLEYENAVCFLKDKNIKTQREYFEWQRGKSSEYKVPSNPRIFYKDKWVSWSDYLGTGNVAFKYRDFYTYKECSDLIKFNMIKSIKEYLKFRIMSMDRKLPSNPDKLYKEWVSWDSFFGIKNTVKKLSYAEAKDFLKDKKISSSREYVQYIKENNNYEINI